MSRRSLALALALLLAVAGAARAQSLEDALGRFANAWARGDAPALASLISRGGVAIDIGGGPVGPLGARQATAVLHRLFDDRETVGARARLAQVVGGAPIRAFGEIVWRTRFHGTTESEEITVFLALVRERDGWRINQIRLLR
jgi:hypothetical protein